MIIVVTAPADIVAGILKGEEAAVVALFEGIWRLRYAYAVRGGLALEPEDQAMDAFLSAWRYVKRGALTDPAALWGAVSTIRFRINCTAIEVREGLAYDKTAAHAIRRLAGEERTDRLIVERDRDETITEALRKLPFKDRQILRMFYREERTQEEIRDEMHLTATQFRLLKSRAIGALRKAGSEVTCPRRRFRTF